VPPTLGTACDNLATLSKRTRRTFVWQHDGPDPIGRLSWPVRMRSTPTVGWGHRGDQRLGLWGVANCAPTFGRDRQGLFAHAGGQRGRRGGNILARRRCLGTAALKTNQLARKALTALPRWPRSSAPSLNRAARFDTCDHFKSFRSITLLIRI
jgi:hypothetical protein